MPSTDPQRTLGSYLQEHADAHPDQTALTFMIGGQPQPVNRAQLLAHARGAAAQLAAQGVGPGDVVLLVLQHSLELVYYFWGAALLGAVPSIFAFLTEKLDPDLYRQRIKTLVEHSEAKAVVTYPENQAALRELLAGLPVQLLVAAGIPEAPTGPLRAAEISAEEIGLLQHSSGSTGMQKGVALSHGAVLRQIAAYRAAIQLDPETDVIVSWLPLYHDMGLIAGFVMPIITGTHLVLMSPFEWVRQPGSLLDAIHTYRGTLCWLPNFAYNLLARTFRPQEGLDLSSWRAVINCSEPAQAESQQLLLEKLAPYGFREEALAVSYAMAENTFAVTQTRIGQPPRVDTVEIAAIQERGAAQPAAEGKRFVSCGPPIARVELRVVDEQGQPLPERRVGEIALRSDFMLSGYHNRPDLSAQALTADGWYLSGDMGYLADGELYITGRKKDLIIVGGKNIYPQDIEAIASRTPGVHPGRAVAFGVFDERQGSEKIVVLCEAAADADPDESERQLRAAIVKETEVTLGDFRFVPRGWIVKTSSGKQARNDNREKYLREFS
ncbi:MAG: AMP-binding protein [Anaerolineales bacterium]|nr:AMP-binding protein [Anaerolineales bacterium]MCW5856177.1 AMP-binding protein [Anaerolineales bacterium]